MFNILPSWIKIILWGASTDHGTKKTPLILRVFLAVMLAVVYIGLSALLLWVGFADHNTVLVILGVVCMISIPTTVVLEVKMKKDS